MSKGIKLAPSEFPKLIAWLSCPIIKSFIVGFLKCDTPFRIILSYKLVSSKFISGIPVNKLLRSENFIKELETLKLKILPSTLSGRNSILLLPSMIQFVKLAATKSLVSVISCPLELL